MKRPSKAKPKGKRGARASPPRAGPIVAQRRERAKVFARPLRPAQLRIRLPTIGAIVAAAKRVSFTESQRDLAILLLPFAAVAVALGVARGVGTAPSPGAVTAGLESGTGEIASSNSGQAALDTRRAGSPKLPRMTALAAVQRTPPALPPVPPRQSASQPDPAPAVARGGEEPVLPAQSADAPPALHIAELEADTRQPAVLPPVGPALLAAKPAAPLRLAATPVPRIVAREAEISVPEGGENVCRVEPHAQPAFTPRPVGLPAAASAPAEAADFGLRLARAARAQMTDFVIYDARYRRISYPMGDVPSLFGVCTDVIVRAYRALGIDLQSLVYEQRTGSGDANIDHRRTETLRRFFSTYGERLPITDFHEDYRPGDIVTYYRPQNRHSHAHIAIVADVTGPSGRPMIVHNRGWGPQLEDALFVDAITGHYRFTGLRPAAGGEAADLLLVATTPLPQGETKKAGDLHAGAALRNLRSP